MNSSKRLMVEFIPKYTNRRIFGSLINGGNNSYKKLMTLTETVTAMTMCKSVKVWHESQDKYYTVHNDTIDEVWKAISEDKAPDEKIVKADSADVRSKVTSTLLSYITALTPDKTVKNKKVSELGEFKIESGNEYGFALYVTGYTDYDTDPKNTEGLYFPFGYTTNTQYTDAKYYLVSNPSNKITLAAENVVRLGSKSTDNVTIAFTAKDTKHDNAEVTEFMVIDKIRTVDNVTPFVNENKKGLAIIAKKKKAEEEARNHQHSGSGSESHHPSSPSGTHSNIPTGGHAVSGSSEHSTPTPVVPGGASASQGGAHSSESGGSHASSAPSGHGSEGHA